MRKDINYRGIDLQVSNKGRIYYKSNGEELEQFQIGNNPYMMCQVYNPVTQKSMLLNVGRIVCMAFHPIEGEDYKNLQAEMDDTQIEQLKETRKDDEREEQKADIPH